MSVHFQCNQCNHRLRVPDESVGKKARCPQCGNIQPVPKASSDVAQESPAAAPFAKPAPLVRDERSGAGAWRESPQREQAYAGNPYQSPAGYSREVSRTPSIGPGSKVLPPAIAMLVVAALGAAFLAILMLAGIISMADEGVQQDDLVLFSFLAVCFVLEGLIIVGSIRMIFLKNYGLAMTAAVLSLLCSVGVCLALPFGVWALVVLCDADVRAHFA